MKGEETTQELKEDPYGSPSSLPQTPKKSTPRSRKVKEEDSTQKGQREKPEDSLSARQQIASRTAKLIKQESVNSPVRNVSLFVDKTSLTDEFAFALPPPFPSIRRLTNLVITVRIYKAPQIRWSTQRWAWNTGYKLFRLIRRPRCMTIWKRMTSWLINSDRDCIPMSMSR